MGWLWILCAQSRLLCAHRRPACHGNRHHGHPEWCGRARVTSGCLAGAKKARKRAQAAAGSDGVPERGGRRGGGRRIFCLVPRRYCRASPGPVRTHGRVSARLHGLLLLLVRVWGAPTRGRAAPTLQDRRGFSLRLPVAAAPDAALAPARRAGPLAATPLRILDVLWAPRRQVGRVAPWHLPQRFHRCAHKTGARADPPRLCRRFEPSFRHRLHLGRLCELPLAGRGVRSVDICGALRATT
mmetsp:Transcript_10398/g.26177  ORF Transcript_10398/g.26177 Transcript_10398/m.26177 type:complete len:241 (+) Transcript_10398:879-1601(+)